MKKIIACTITAVLLISALCCAGIVASADDTAPFWLTHYNDGSREGAGVIFTEADGAGAWWSHVAFAPVAGAPNAYEIVGISLGNEGKGSALEIPEGGFVYGVNTGNDWPSLYASDPVTYANYKDYPKYFNDNSAAMWETLFGWNMGDKFVIRGLDLKNLTVPTTTADKNWYEDGYVCTATFAPYDPNATTSSDETTSDSASSDDTSATPDPVAEYTAAIAEKLGAAVADSAMNVTLSNVVAEDGTITVTLTIDGLKDGAQVDVLEGALCYDAEKLTLTTNLEDLTLTSAPDSDWETLTAPAGEGKLDFSAFTTKAKTLLNKDSKLTMDLTFALKDGCTYGAVWMENGVSGEETDLDTGAAKNTYKANGAYTVINTSSAGDVSADTSSEDSSSATSSTTPKPGDAGIVVFALLGLVAVAGAAVVIKVRH